MSDDTVRVAVRIRPLVPTEIEKGCETCIGVVPGEQKIQVRNSNKSFTFNHVFGPEDDQEILYNTAVSGMVNKIFEGYNVTILAYGQSRSGKTHSMATYSGHEVTGVIPRAVNHLFNVMETMNDHTFKVTVSFMELYEGQAYDLFSDKSRNQRTVGIREEKNKIKIVGLTEKQVTNATDTLQCLTARSHERTTGETAMNARSSRSHAVFTIIIYQTKNSDRNTATMSKFHLVDLAGSERSKKTRATGERFKEGVNINKDLLALGNVISQLGKRDPPRYINYRDSKLTLLLQDSLGGNSITLMIACVSPADYNLSETLCTLRYADRVRKIHNKPIMNIDPKAGDLVQQRRLAMADQDIGSSTSCPPEHAELEEQNRLLQLKVRELTNQLNRNLIDMVNMHERAELAEQEHESINVTMPYILDELKQGLDNLEESSSNRAKLQTTYNKALALLDDHQKTEAKIIQLITASNAVNESIGDENPAECEVSHGSDHELMCDLDEEHAKHAQQQTEKNNEIQNMTLRVALKWKMITKLRKESVPSVEQSKELQDMENEIKTHQAEKEQLMLLLEQVLQNEQTNRVRNTVQELKNEIDELSKKCTEQARVIAMKEKSEQRIKNVSAEIHSLNQERVKLIREMRREEDKFARWKRAKERELDKLKDQDRKREAEMVKLQTDHSKQQHVHKREMEEASTINKRLKKALELQHKAHQRRENDANSKENDIENWLQQEVADVVSTIDAECNVQKLMQDRAQLTKKLHTLKASVSNDPESKAQIAELTKDIEVRNAQIVHLQQNIMESDQENRPNTRWMDTSIQSMDDAETALKILIDMTASDREKSSMQSQEMDELMEKYDSEKIKCQNLAQKLKEVEAELKNTEAQLNTYKEKYDGVEAETFTKAELKKARIQPLGDLSNLGIKESNFLRADGTNDVSETFASRPSLFVALRTR